MNKIINIAILAHVDAGKTTLTEQMLFLGGKLKDIGNVDKGTTISDYLEVERDRGISVVASNVNFNFRGVDFNIIDTPGHADFMSEVERSLMATDMVVLLISAPDGVQSQTRILWHLLEKLNMPRIILVNKVDRIGVDLNSVLEELKTEFGNTLIPIQSVDIENEEEIVISSIFNGTLLDLDQFYEFISGYSDGILESYLQGESIPNELIQEVYRKEFMGNSITPIMFSVAKTSIGVEMLLEEIINLTSYNIIEDKDSLSAIVYKLSHNKQLGLISHIRIFSGIIQKRQEVYNNRTHQREKVNQIKKVFSDKLIDIDIAQKGQIVAVSGFANARVGDFLGEKKLDKEFTFDTIPILTVEVKPINDEQFSLLAEALAQLDIEDPLLDFKWFKDENQLHIKVNGLIQIEILQRIIIDRFGIETSFEPPSIIYKETPITTTFGYEEYTMPKPCWAVVKFKVEPTERGIGVRFYSQVGVNDILLKYQKEIERAIPFVLEQGIKGWEVTDIDITLVEGEDHIMHSRPGDFAIATSMAIMNALNNSNTHLLEPILKFELQGPESILGQVVSDIYKMRGEFEQPIFFDEKIKILGKIPAATSLEYASKLASLSGGKAFMLLQFDSYQIVEDEYGIIREYKGISPLNRAKYILKARKAIQ